MLTVEQRNFKAFEYLLKKKPQEYRGIYASKDIYVGFHIYEQTIPGQQWAKVRELFRITSDEIKKLRNWNM